MCTDCCVQAVVVEMLRRIKGKNAVGVTANEHKLRVQDAENEKSEHVSTEKKKSSATEVGACEHRQEEELGN